VISIITFCEMYKLCSRLQPPTTFSLLGWNILLAPCSKTPSIYRLPFMWDQVSQSYKTTDKIIVFFLYFNIYVFREAIGRKNILNWMSWSISRI
jgi:hypothetical protein